MRREKQGDLAPAFFSGLDLDEIVSSRHPGKGCRFTTLRPLVPIPSGLAQDAKNTKKSFFLLFAETPKSKNMALGQN